MKSKPIDAIRVLIPLAIWFAITFALFRIYEVILSSGNNIAKWQALGFFMDLSFASRCALVITACATLISFFNLRAGRIVAVASYTVTLAASFLIITYFCQTGVPLAADVFAYNLSEIKTTVIASSKSSLVSVLALLLYLAFFFGGVIYLSRRSSTVSISWSMMIALLLFVAAVLPATSSFDTYSKESEYLAVMNKPEYFTLRSFAHFTQNNRVKLVPGTYPFLRTLRDVDVLGNHFSFHDKPPNLVFLLVEGLGRDFTGPDALYGGFTPFLDSLSKKSLYWKNCLSNAGRTFGVLPSVLGSLPYGEEGFLNYGVDMPEHQTLITLLRDRGYASYYFYGGNVGFDHQDLFLQYQGTDFIVSESNFPSRYKKSAADNEGFTWGFPDRDLLNYSLEVINDTSKSPRVDVYLTLTTHEPFVCPDERFVAKAQSYLFAHPLLDENATQYKDIFACLLYTDDALRRFFLEYAKLPEFANTIFVITGDHRLIPVPHESRLSRFHVPLIVYSPMLRNPRTFSSIVTHADIPQAFIAMLQRNFKMEFPKAMPFISQAMDTSTSFKSNADVAIMRNKGDLSDYIFRDYFLSDDRLYKINSSMNLELIRNDSLKEALQDKLENFRMRSIAACEYNRVDSVVSARKFKTFELTASEETFVMDEGLAGMTPDEIFLKAKDFARDLKYEKSRIVLRYLLNAVPNFHDARLLLGRTFAWQNRYDTARFFFDQVLQRSPAYIDAFAAKSDLAYWNQEVALSLAIAEAGLKLNADHPDLLAQKARGLLALGKQSEAKKIISDLLLRYPSHQLAQELKIKLQP